MVSQRPTGGCRRGTTSTLCCRAGTPTAPRPRTSRPFACWTGCHLGPSAVKAYLLGKQRLRDTPLTAPGPRRPSDTGRPGRARSRARPAASTRRPSREVRVPHRLPRAMPGPLVHLPLPPGGRHAAHRVDPRPRHDQCPPGPSRRPSCWSWAAGWPWCAATSPCSSTTRPTTPDQASRQEARSVADQLWDPHPRQHLLTPTQEGGPGTRPGPPPRPTRQHQP